MYTKDPSALKLVLSVDCSLLEVSVWSFSFPFLSELLLLFGCHIGNVPPCRACRSYFRSLSHSFLWIVLTSLILLVGVQLVCSIGTNCLCWLNSCFIPGAGKSMTMCPCNLLVSDRRQFFLHVIFLLFWGRNFCSFCKFHLIVLVFVLFLVAVGFGFLSLSLLQTW